jgi:hypothetical protein
MSASAPIADPLIRRGIGVLGDNTFLWQPLTGRVSHAVLVNDTLKVYQFAQTGYLVYEKVIFISLSLHAGSNRTHMSYKKGEISCP